MATQAGPVDADSLQKLKLKGIGGPILPLRLEYMESAHLLNHYVGPAAGRPLKSKTKDSWLKSDGRCYPGMMPTQASGRWSIVAPPLPTFPPEYRSIVIPDPGHGWVVWDYDAIEARLVACMTHDQDDLDAFEKGWDLHTLTAAGIFRFPRPTNYANPHTSPEDAEWRAALKWGGKDDRRRYLAKTARYSLFYALDHRGILEVKDIEKMGETPESMLRVGYDYLRSKPRLVSTRKHYWNRCWQEHKAVTAFGRERPLMGKPKDVKKEGWNHMIQGTAVDILNLALIGIDTRWPDEATLCWQSHDSGTIDFPLEVEWWPAIQSIVEQTHTIAGHPMTFTASWYVIPPGGHVHDDRCRPEKCYRITPQEWFASERVRYAGATPGSN